jgi:hypothetical protein
VPNAVYVRPDDGPATDPDAASDAQGSDGAPVDGSTPPGLDPADIQARFFVDDGPTNIYVLLGLVDRSISAINEGALETAAPCLGGPPVPYVITPFGESTDPRGTHDGQNLRIPK